MIYTLIGEDMAEEGAQFIAQDSEVCKDCKRYPTCIKNLDMGRRYTIKKVRDKTFKCKISGKVILVEVEPAEIPLLVKKKKAIEGMELKFSPPSHEKKELFNPYGLDPGDRVKITRVMENHGDKKKVMVVVL
ncbi:MAG: UPF0179 family protein [Euryarchaeota archaeon]|nr:UPF0179 family protein [Euryarchaeota archaeon]